MSSTASSARLGAVVGAAMAQPDIQVPHSRNGVRMAARRGARPPGMGAPLRARRVSAKVRSLSTKRMCAIMDKAMNEPESPKKALRRRLLEDRLALSDRKERSAALQQV